jgi:hypothetical protein
MTPKAEISEWFDHGVRDGAVFMIVACDTFDHSDYPVYADDERQCLEQYERCDGKGMQRVMEVYDLRGDKATQLKESRAWHLPLLATGNQASAGTSGSLRSEAKEQDPTTSAPPDSKGTP